jgi:phenylacetate-CoA ligase
MYLRSPKMLQNLLVSVKGLQLERQRRRGRYGEFLSAIRQRNGFSRDQFQRYQAERLRHLLALAAGTVPYYQESFRTAGVQPGDFGSVLDLSRFPLLPKSEVRMRARELVSRTRAPSRLLQFNTTGTTGSPMTLYSDHQARQENYAHFDNFFELVGLDPHARRAVFGGRILQPGTDWRPPFWRHSRFQQTLLFSSYHLAQSTVDAYLNALRQFQPAVLEGYPSSLSTLARFMLERGETLPVSGVVTSSETLLDDQREAIELAFASRVFDQYGAAEQCVFVGQCRKGRYHVRPDYGVVELVRDGVPVTEAGQEGEVVCTGFINEAMPLIRYQIGDLACWAAGGCDCGLDTPILESVLGRRDDLIITPEGSRVGRLSPVLKGFPVREAQYVQERSGALTVLLVPAPGFDAVMLSRLETELRKRVGPTIPIDFRQVASLPRGAGGKFRAVISHYRS